MLKKILRGLFTIIGLVLGYIIGESILKTGIGFVKYIKANAVGTIIFLIICTAIFGFIMFLISPFLNSLITKGMESVEGNFQKLPANDVLFGTVGAIIGLIIAVLITGYFVNFGILGIVIGILVDLVFAALGANIAIRKREEITLFFSGLKKNSNKEKEKKVKNNYKGTPKVLDTSVIIDGRILDICRTGFVEGTLVIPNFVLEELRHIADSSDDLKRNRGRRGLDILNKIQKELDIDVEICEKDFPEIAEVDSKLLKLSQVLNGKVITNDFNLNKVAQFQGVEVLNINELANSVKPMVLPGEEMTIQIVKDGKESGQGVAYLDDGTMIVVEGGRKFIGQTKNVIVTSVLQTAAGRMIFAKQRD